MTADEAKPVKCLIGGYVAGKNQDDESYKCGQVYRQLFCQENMIIPTNTIIKKAIENVINSWLLREFVSWFSAGGNYNTHPEMSACQIPNYSLLIKSCR